MRRTAIMVASVVLASWGRRAVAVETELKLSDRVRRYLVEAGDTSVVEYDLRSGDGVQRWVEIVEWDGDRVRHARVYMLPSVA